jgi:hypothetical protein
MKLALNNKDMFNLEYIQKFKINFEPPTWQTNATEKKDQVMSDVSSVVKIILRIARDVILIWGVCILLRVWYRMILGF